MIDYNPNWGKTHTNVLLRSLLRHFNQGNYMKGAASTVHNKLGKEKPVGKLS